jgi:3-oxoacyl-[acyl-carrier protein] reductase
MNLTFSGKTALLCGGGCDLGLALAPLLSNHGIRPVLTYRSPVSLNRITEALKDISGNYDTCFLDLNHIPTIDKVFSSMDSSLDYLVDFAQGDYEALVASADPIKIAGYMEANVTAKAVMLKNAGRIMIKQRGGRLVFVSSTAAGRPNPGQGFYAASKLAAESLYKNMALELGRMGISAVTLRPGYIEAGRGKGFIETNRDALIKRIPSQSFVSADDVAATILFLLSDQGKGFNATELTMDGGLSAGK